MSILNTARRLPPEDEMFDALLARDSRYTGIFLVCVRTTGIFCRPTCHARKPRRENVEFVASATEAMHAGYRPCKVCDPLGVADARPAWMPSLVERVRARPDRRLTDADLRTEGLEPETVRRAFKKHFGVTFHAFQRAARLGTAMKHLHDGDPVTAAALRSGYRSESGFRDAFGRLFGTSPDRGRDTAVLHAKWMDTPLGAMLGLASDRGLALLEFVDRPALEREINDVRRAARAVVVPTSNAHLDRMADELRAYFDGRAPTFTVPLDTPTTPFQRAVWDALCAIPSGRTATYADIAAQVGRPGASRAVGRANGSNRCAIVIPCHRVIRSDGALCGYGGGIWRKRALLDLERSTA
ncbi:MAG: methylated-DNA--[protein]-cysteine S-methyltransferase [Phycisphaerales bacterium]|nr:methylated-DNA--[protein]-cysteine S-methyltransferase [Phycisphaerales bacterium]